MSSQKTPGHWVNCGVTHRRRKGVPAPACPGEFFSLDSWAPLPPVTFAPSILCHSTVLPGNLSLLVGAFLRTDTYVIPTLDSYAKHKLKHTSSPQFLGSPLATILVLFHVLSKIPKRTPSSSRFLDSSHVDASYPLAVKSLPYLAAPPQHLTLLKYLDTCGPHGATLSWFYS